MTLGRFSGLTIAGLSRSYFGDRLDAFETVVGLTRGVVFPLIADVVGHPGKVLGPETDYPIARLPGEAVAVQDALVEVVGAGAFELADPVADLDGRRHRHGQVNVVVGSADSVTDGSGRLLYALFEELVEVMLDGIVD